MLTDEQRQQILEFCREHQIAKLWLLDGPLPDGCSNANGPTAIVAFHTHWRPDYVAFARMGFDFQAIIGPGTGFYPALGLPPALAEPTLSRARLIYGHSPLDGPAPRNAGWQDASWQDAVKRFCRKNHIIRLWALNEPLGDLDSAPTVAYELVAGSHLKGRYGDEFDIEDELRSIIGAGATMYSLDCLAPSVQEKICQQAEFRYADHLAG